jgi:hypothetical protein
VQGRPAPVACPHSEKELSPLFGGED